MVKFIIKALLKVIMFLVDIVLAPLNLLIRALMPDFANIISIVNGFFDMLGDYSAIAVSYLGLTPLVLNSILLLLGAIISIPLAVHTIKLAIRWYNALKF